MYFLSGASNDLSTCWAFQSVFYFDLHQQGMEWSRLGLSPPEAPRTSQSPALVRARRRHGSDLLFRGCSSPVDLKTIELCCLRSQGCGLAVQDTFVALSRTESEERQAELSQIQLRYPCLIQGRQCGIINANAVAERVN